MQAALRRTGLQCQLSFARSGQQAIDYLDGKGDFSDREQYQIPDVIFLDLKMPLKDGFDVLTWMKGREFRVPVAVLSSSTIERDVQRARELGAAEYLLKPPTRERILACLNRINGSAS